MKAALTVAIAGAAALLALAQSPAQQTQTPASQASPAAGGRGRGPQTPPPPRVTPKAEELARIREKTEQIEKLAAELKAEHADPVLLNDVEVYAKAGRFLIEYPELFGTQAAIDHSFEVLDQGIERAHQLMEGKPGWEQGNKRIEAYRSEIDGALQPYGLTFPANYDPSKPTRLYVWLHGRSNDQTEAEFISSFQRTRPPGNAPVADQGQIQLDCFGRINGAGWHWAGEMEPLEAIAAVERRYKIDDRRVILRGFSQGGEGAWNISLHYPDRFAAAEVGAGTVSGTVQRRAARGLPPLEPFQLATLKIWENMPEWALNIYNLPLAGHDGENDPGQLESSLRTRAQLEKEGFPSEGERDFKHSIGAPGLWLQSLNTGHGTSPLVRQRLDAFLKEWGDKGQTDPDHLKFVTYTTRYNKQYWISVEGLDRHYQRADLDAVRSDDRRAYDITTHNISRLVLRETDHAKEIKIDGQSLKAVSRPEIALRKTGATWKVDGSLVEKGLHKTHALQGPIDDAFLDPFLMVRPTGTPWNDEVNQQALRTMAHFDRMWGKFFRGHPFAKDDKDVTAEDMAKYHIVLFGDPGSNKLIARLQGKLPVKWTRETVTMAGRDFPAKENLPALIYPNPLNPSKYVVVNSGLDIDDAGYNGDYGTPMWGDYAVVKVKPGADMPDLQMGGLFDENWKLVP
jgi:pimeloyl-ACP methyl ester carboxylesterase